MPGFMRNQLGQAGYGKQPYGFNPYAAGDKMYGLSGRANATAGPITSQQGQQGYRERDARARRQAVLQRLQAMQSGNYMNADYLRGAR